MPAGQTEFSQQGEVSEQFASLFLSDLAFVTRVRRPMDVGHDLICVLKEPDCREKQTVPLGRPILAIGIADIWDGENILQGPNPT